MLNSSLISSRDFTALLLFVNVLLLCRAALALGVCRGTQDQEFGRSAGRDTDEEARDQTETL